ncbi:MAG: hypothetical protein JST82_00810 [Bacteroidetes bacterium]|nr:hypothetical protein [Bacteroidota bacterium]
MREGFLNLAEATALCAAYQDLVGLPFCGEYRGLGTIEAVVVAPLGKLDKFYFLKQLELYKDAQQALASYSGSEYDVVLIGHDQDNNITARDLKAHLAYGVQHPGLLISLD